MQQRGGALREIVFGGLFGVGAVAADGAVGRAGDVVFARMGGGEGGADAIVDALGRIALVAAHVDAYRGMAAYAEHVVLNVAQEHGIIVGIGAIPGIGQPEILPDDDAVAVAGFVELVLADLAHPVADHVEIHFRVIAHGGVIFAGAVAQHAFAEAPTAALGNEAAAVDPHFESAAFLAVSELPHARLELFGVGNGVGGGFELQAHVVEIGRAVSGGPPQLRVDELQGVLDALELGGGEGDGEIEGLGAEASAQGPGDGGGGMILEDYLDLDGGTGGIGEREGGNDAGIPQGDWAGGVEVNAVPYAGFTAADGGDPIPAYGCVEGGIIGAESAAVFIGIQNGGFLDAAGRGGFEDAHGEGVVAAGEQLRSHIEAAAREGAIDAAEFFAVEEDFGFPIDAVEVEPDFLAGKGGRRGELVAIPEVGLEKAVGDHQLVVGEVGVGDGAGVE